MQFEEFEYELNFPIEIGKGDFCSILAISDSHAVKLSRDPNYNCLDQLIQESEIAFDLYNAGISVPKPEGLFRIKTRNDDLSFEEIGFVMERIKGIRGDKVEGSLKDKVIELVEIELDKSEQKGFIPFDTGLHNCMYLSKEKKVYLTDFDGWKKRDYILLASSKDLPNQVGDIFFEGNKYFIGERGFGDRCGTIKRTRGKVLLYLLGNIGKEFSSDEISQMFEVNESTVVREMNRLHNQLRYNSFKYHLSLSKKNSRKYTLNSIE